MSKTTTNPPKKEDDLKVKNEAVKTAYFNILELIKKALPQYNTEYIRTYIEVDYSTLGISCQHAFFNPLIHIQLEEVEGALIIKFSRNLTLKQQVSNHLDGLLSRIVYNETSEIKTTVFIEDCLIAEAYQIDDFRQANGLLAKGFKDAKKVTV